MNTRFLPLLVVVVLLCGSPAQAQLHSFGEAGVVLGHLHLLARDVDATKKFFVTLGGIPVQNGSLQLIQFPGVFIMLREGQPTGPMESGVVNHMGFNVPELKTAVARWRAGGLMVDVTRDDQAWLLTPDGARIEIFEDKATVEPIRMHHLHWRVTQVPEAQAWYAKHFGAVPGKRRQYDTDDLPGLNMTLQKWDSVYPGTKGRALDHIGFEVRDLAAFVAKLEANGVKTEGPVRKASNGKTSIAFLTDPWGTYIELTEGLAP